MIVTVKVKLYIATRHAGAKVERKYSSYSFLNSVLGGVSGQRHTPAALCPGKGLPVSIGQEAGWASELVWTQMLEIKSLASVRE
jgi:hypothetical protein